MEETTENYSQPAPEAKNIVLIPQAQEYLRQAGSWAKFVGIVGFIFSGFVALAALSIGKSVTMLAAASPALALFAGAGALFTFVYVLFALLGFFLSLWLYQFGDRVNNGVMYGDSENVANGLGKLKSAFKLLGIVIIAYLVIVVLVIIAFIVGIGISAGAR